ncbi:MAG: hypothetical protein ACR2K0_09880 [Acidimicrobiales bacterium]|jgi:Arc/MetJ-type ribon-helix-helix transcriptional regulator
MATEQIAVRLPVELLSAIDDLVDRGRYEGRAAAVGAGIVALTEAERRRVHQDLIDGHSGIPPAPSEDVTALASLRSAIAEEPW